MALATADLLITTPVAAYGMYLNLSESQIHPWISWADTHYDYSHVSQYLSMFWRMDRNSVIAFELSRWAPIFCAFVSLVSSASRGGEEELPPSMVEISTSFSQLFLRTGVQRSVGWTKEGPETQSEAPFHCSSPALLGLTIWPICIHARLCG
ncbi:hypothetical protein A0H81_05274 [Grifola frondosa]|uniref:Uncharacterized protein n=1 Tax=Grifola frondosa TaxID=5627 RepID=A0A1C7MC26_GRIFR|nr:hypothetical protein A0H81_05274 [Grifola frondosa]